MKCKICGSITKEEFDKQIKVNTYFCDCGFIFQDRVIDGDVEYDHYAKHDNSFENKGYVNMFERFIDKTKDYIVGDCLEYGCGPGPVLAELLKQQGHFVKTYDKYFDHDDDYDNYMYDTVTMTEVIEHFDEPMEELKKIKDLLKPNGRLIIQTMFIQEPFFDWWYRRDYTHISFFNEEVFKLIAELLGFNILYTDNSSIIVLENV